MGATRGDYDSNIMFLSLKDGKFVRKADEGAGNGIDDKDLYKHGLRVRKYVDKETGAQHEVLEEFFDTVDGLITAVYFYEPSFGGVVLRMKMKDSDGSDILLSIPYGDGKGNIYPYAKSFIQKIHGLKLDSPVIMSSYKIHDKEKSALKGRDIYVQGLVMHQDGEKIMNVFTKDNPAGVPEAVQKMVQGKQVWNFDDVNEFMYAKLTEYMAKVEEKFPRDGEVAAPEIDSQADAASTPEAGVDDLPF